MSPVRVGVNFVTDLIDGVCQIANMRFARRRRFRRDLAALISDSEALHPGWEQIVNNSINHPRHPFYETYYAVKVNPILDRLTLQVNGTSAGYCRNRDFPRAYLARAETLRRICRAEEGEYQPQASSCDPEIFRR